MLHKLKITNNILQYAGTEIDLSVAVQVELYQMTLMRSEWIGGFEPGNIFESAKGIRINMINREHGVIIPVVFSVKGEALSVSVKTGAIVEQYGSMVRIMKIKLLPELLVARTGSEGYFVLPNYSGLLVNFTQKKPLVISDRIYMEQQHWEKMIMMNCFAMIKEGNGILAVVNEGDFFCHVTTEINQDGMNRIYPSFGVRHDPDENIDQGTKEVLYYISDAANYVKLAQIYREYLINERGVSPLKERISSNPVLDYSTKAMRVKMFLGMKVPFRADGSIPMTTYTTFKQGEELLDEMKRAGIEKAVITLVGWNLGGHDGAYPTRFPVEPLLGGEEGLKNLIAKAKSIGYQITVHDNVTDIYRSAMDFDYEYAAKTPRGEALPAGLWGGGQSFKACPTVYLNRYGYDFDRIEDLGFDGHYYMDAQCTVLWRCHDQVHPADEEEFALSLVKMTSIPREKYGAVAIEFPSAFSLPFIDEAARIHNAITCKGMFSQLPAEFLDIVDKAIPFYQIALHGLITYQDHWIHCYENPRYGWLLELAFGARPSIEISHTGSPNSDVCANSLNLVMEAYQIQFEQLKDIHTEFIVGFEENNNGLYIVTYESGVRVSVNTSCEDISDIQPLSYKIERI